MGNTYSENRVCSCSDKPSQSTHQSPAKSERHRSISLSLPLSDQRTSNIGHSSAIRPSQSFASASHSKELPKLSLERLDNAKSSCCDNDKKSKLSIAKAAGAKREFRKEKEKIKEKETSGSPQRQNPHPSDSPPPLVFCDVNNRLKQLSLSSGSSKSKNLSNNDGTTQETEVEETQTLEIPAVYYYGWFFTPETSEAINKVVMHIFQSCLKENSQFEKFILNCCKEVDIRDPMELYNYKRPGKKIRPEDELTYHITARFMGKVRHIDYQTFVRDFLDKRFYIHLIGIVFTPRTLGVRVKLTKAQQLLFDEKDDKTSPLSFASGEEIAKNKNLIDEELGSYGKLKRLHKQNPKCKFKKDESKIAFKRLKGKSSPLVVTTSSRAHITIACAPNVKPKMTGDDLVEIINLEQRPVTRNANFQKDFQLKYGILRQFGMHGEAFVFYSDWEMIVPGRFNYLV